MLVGFKEFVMNVSVSDYDDDMGYVDYVLIGGGLVLVHCTILPLTTGMCIFYCTKRKSKSKVIIIVKLHDINFTFLELGIIVNDD